MKTIIIEGTDCTGKNTLIKGLINHYIDIYPNILYKHFKAPKGKTIEEKKTKQLISYNKLMEQIGSEDKDTLLICNRSYIGEYVYAPMYRNIDPSYIWELERINEINKHDVTLILLEGDTEFIISNDDGKSFSNKYENKKREQELFRESLFKSRIKNKHIIKVNDEKNSFKKKNKILKEVLKLF